MKIGKTTPAGAFYTMPEANNRFAKKEDIGDISNEVEDLTKQVGTLSTDIEAIQDALEEFDTMIPTPEAADDGKVLTANASGGYDLEEVNINTKLDRKNARGEGYIAFNPATNSNIGTNAVNLGTGNKTTNNGSVGIGNNNSVSGSGCMTFGKSNSVLASTYDSYGIGDNNSLTRISNCYAFGRYLLVDGDWTNENNLRLLLGAFNALPSLSNCFLIIGGGTASNNRKNILEMDNDGNAVFSGTVNGIPHAPTTDGTYKLQCTVTNGEPAFSWVSEV